MKSKSKVIFFHAKPLTPENLSSYRKLIFRSRGFKIRALSLARIRQAIFNGLNLRTEMSYFHPTKNFADTSGIVAVSVGADYIFPTR